MALASAVISPIVMIGTFGIRNDKNRGLLVESLETADGTVYFFKHHDQPLSSHCQQLQNIVKAANVRRARKLHIDVTEFSHEYFQPSDMAVMFRATKLQSVRDQAEKVFSMRLNKEIAIVKRKETMAERLQTTIVNEKLTSTVTVSEKSKPNQSIKRKLKSTRDITFSSGETNPILFLAEFEKCHDVSTDDDKISKIRYFVNEEHKAEFSQIRFTGNWATAKTKFLTTYSLPFIENKKRDMNFDFKEEANLRSFFNRKFSMFAKYTTLPFVNQMEIILNDLPIDIAHLFMVHGKFDNDKNDILDFCDSVQDISEKFTEDQNIPKAKEPLNYMEVFDYDPEDIHEQQSDSSVASSHQQSTSRSREDRVRSNASSSGRIVKRGRPRKQKVATMSAIKEAFETTDYNFLDEVSNSTTSSWSTHA
ncbi:hypothetical protein Bhyg_13198 [Pseudolycoriella hygida]|uniref:Uncharacterized protein n=1 Tax=Pseudolycoriella hygida TaxID=35572 RepID=A0A9Q0MMI6_9DIPT|nr:hypothetical protein Bhyg_13198 [Pseudolycoriella hygida]